MIQKGLTYRLRSLEAVFANRGQGVRRLATAVPPFYPELPKISSPADPASDTHSNPRGSTPTREGPETFGAPPVGSSERGHANSPDYDAIRADHLGPQLGKGDHRRTSVLRNGRRSEFELNRRDEETPKYGKRTTPVETWDHLFSWARPDQEAINPESSQRGLAERLRDTIPDHESGISASRGPRSYSQRRRAQGQTGDEAAVFDRVLSSIFLDLETAGPLRPGSSPHSDPYSSQFGSRRLTEGSRSVRRDFDGIEEKPDIQVMAEVDELKEDLSTVQTDIELFEWAQKKIFTPQVSEDGGEPYFPRSYPYILAHLIKIARTNFNNPHLALALFQYAQTLSIESYIFGCLTSAYNELLRTRWECFQDLEGVEQGIMEMEANGVGWDKQTEKLVTAVTDSVSRNLVESGEVSMWMDHQVERLAGLEQRLEAYIRRQEEIVAERRRRANPQRRVESSPPAFLDSSTDPMSRRPAYEDEAVPRDREESWGWESENEEQQFAYGV